MSRMNTTWAAILGTAACLAAIGEPPAEFPRTLKEAEQRLRKLGSVKGASVGYLGEPSEYYELSEVISRVGTAGDFERLAQDENVIVRAMGLHCMARLPGQRTVALLRSRLSSHESFWCCPGGCVSRPTTEGEFAWELLHDPLYLGGSFPSVLMRPDEKVALDLQILGGDQYRAMHIRSGEKIDRLLKRRKLPLDLDRFRAALPNVSDLELIKGVGRLTPCMQTRKFLMSCLQDTKLSGHARLAAASGLTRDPHVEAMICLEESRPTLERLSSVDTANRIIDTFYRRWAYNREAGRFSATMGEEAEKQAEVVRVALAFDEPFALHDLVQGAMLFNTRDRPDIARIARDSLVRLSERLDEVAEPWNTDSVVIDHLGDYLDQGLFSDKHDRLSINVDKAAFRREALADSPSDRK